MGADNQQERLDTKWVSGFADGEGCFYVGINRIPKMTLKWQVLPEFRIVQHKRDIKILKKIQNTLGYGDIRRNHGDRFELRVRKLDDLKKLIRFFERNPLMTKKRNDFLLFKEILNRINRKEHLDEKGLHKIAKLASQMNRHTLPRYLKSSETIRQTFDTESQMKI